MGQRAILGRGLDRSFLKREIRVGGPPKSLSESLSPKWRAQRTHILTLKDAKKPALENKMLKVG